jgi:hypothetical protein
MKDKYEEFIDRMINQQHDDLGELCNCFDTMVKQGMYKEMLPILRMIEETVPEVYQAYYKKAEQGAEYQRNINYDLL